MKLALEKDLIEVELEPEKKGLVLKHREYTVTSRQHKVSVQRRYNDFVSFHEVLLMRYPYRLVPKLPPKKIVANNEFIEGRRRALRRFLNIVSKHPAMSYDPIITYFLTFKGSDVGHKLKEQYKGVPDEFMTNTMAANAKEMVPQDTQGNLSNSKQQIYTIHRCVEQMRDVIERLAGRSTGNAVDMLNFSKNLSVLVEDSSPVTSWATGGTKTWVHLQKGFKSLVVPFASIAEKCAVHSSKETEEVSDYLEVFLDLTTGYKDLIERHEKGVLRDHQIALHKMQQYKQRHMSATVKGNDSVDQLEHKIVQQEGAIHTMENRNYFSLYCLQMETQLIHANMDVLVEMLRNLVKIQIRKHNELCSQWEDMKGPVDQLAESVKGGASSPTSNTPQISPTQASAPSFFD